MSKCTRLVRLPTLSMMGPDKELRLSISSFRAVNLDMSGAKDPTRLFPLRAITITRSLSSAWIPCHSRSGLSLSQLVLLTQLSPSVEW